MSKKWFSRKLNKQLLVLTLSIAVPVLVLIAYIGFRNNQVQLNELLLEEQSDVQAAVLQLDSLMEILENSLAYMAMEDTRIQGIAQAEIQDTQFWLDNNAVLRRLNNQTVVNPLRFTTFIYYPEQDIFYNSDADPGFAKKIRSLTESEDPVFADRSWNILECEGNE